MFLFENIRTEIDRTNRKQQVARVRGSSLTKQDPIGRIPSTVSCRVQTGQYINSRGKNQSIIPSEDDDLFVSECFCLENRSNPYRKKYMCEYLHQNVYIHSTLAYIFIKERKPILIQTQGSGDTQ
jgi:hypothetical protein